MEPVFIGVLPNFGKEEFALAKKLLFQKSAELKPKLTLGQLRENLLAELGAKKSELFLVDSARSAFFLALQALDLPPGSEVILPAFTCVVIVNPVLWAGLKPVYADISAVDFNTPLPQILGKVTAKTKVILVQHTFGAVLDVEKLQAELKAMGRSDIYLVEDLAHSLGGNYLTSAAKLGTKSDFAVLTFGVEKMISSIRGGGLVVNETAKTKPLHKRLTQAYAKLVPLAPRTERRLLLNPVFWHVALPFYYFGYGKFTLGRLLVAVAHKLKLLGIQIEPEEYAGGKPKYLPAKLTPRLAKIGLLQLSKLKQFNAHRRQLAKYYMGFIQTMSIADNSEQSYIRDVLNTNTPHTFLRYPLLLNNSNQREALFRLAKRNKIVLGDWYKTMFYTQGRYLAKLGYEYGMCPNAEAVSKRIINLPTAQNTTPEHVREICKLIKQVVE